MENKIYSVYLLTEDVPWAGYTGNIRKRMINHKCLGKITNTKNHRVLHTTTDISEAMELESLLHDEGYLGRHIGGQRNVESGHWQKILEAKRIPIKQYTRDGKFIQEFASQHEASRELNLHQSSINNVLKGQRKTCGGFVFKYKELATA